MKDCDYNYTQEIKRVELKQMISEYEKNSQSIERMKNDYLIHKKNLIEVLKETSEKMITSESFLIYNKDLTRSLIQLPVMCKNIENYENLIFSYIKLRDYKKLELVHNMIMVNVIN